MFEQAPKNKDMLTHTDKHNTKQLQTAQILF